jgi:thiol:disulfide interchange protein DsbC
MDSIWCSANRNEALTKAKQGMPIPSASCATPIKAQYELGQELGVRGTPAVFLENGTQVGGYLSPKDLAAAIGIK